MLESIFLFQSDGERKSARKIRENGRKVCKGGAAIGKYAKQKTYRIKSDDIELRSY